MFKYLNLFFIHSIYFYRKNKDIWSIIFLLGRYRKKNLKHELKFKFFVDFSDFFTFKYIHLNSCFRTLYIT